MDTFFQFNILPAELRLQIWDIALHEEAQNRLVFLEELCVVPLKHLISPLLAVNVESRQRARSFYNLKLEVYALMPRLDKYRVECNNSNHSWECQVAWQVIGQTIEGIEEMGKRKGVIFLSPEFDGFVVGVECFSPLHKFMVDNIDKDEVMSPYGVRHHMSAKISREACRTVRRVVQALDFPDHGHTTTKFIKAQVDLLWQTGIFTGIQEYGYLRMIRSIYGNAFEFDERFLSKVQQAGGGSCEVQELAWRLGAEDGMEILEDPHEVEE